MPFYFLDYFQSIPEVYESVPELALLMTAQDIIKAAWIELQKSDLSWEKQVRLLFIQYQKQNEEQKSLFIKTRNSIQDLRTSCERIISISKNHEPEIIKEFLYQFCLQCVKVRGCLWEIQRITQNIDDLRPLYTFVDLFHNSNAFYFPSLSLETLNEKIEFHVQQLQAKKEQTLLQNELFNSNKDTNKKRL